MGLLGACGGYFMYHGDAWCNFSVYWLLGDAGALWEMLVHCGRLWRIVGDCGALCEMWRIVGDCKVHWKMVVYSQ